VFTFVVTVRLLRCVTLLFVVRCCYVVALRVALFVPGCCCSLLFVVPRSPFDFPFDPLLLRLFTTFTLRLIVDCC
jgi:hypothetical protein